MIKRMLLLISLIMLNTEFTIASDTCLDLVKQNKEILDLSCDSLEIGRKIVEGKEVVPSKIYHYGKRSILDKNIAARNIPQQDWDNYIVGDKGRFKLEKERRGLYGTAGLDTNSFGGEDNWVMQISIKDSCRKPEKIISLFNINEDKKFIKWFKTKKFPMTLKQFPEACQIRSVEGYSDPVCRNIVNAFIDENKIAIVLDHIIEKSFYIKDRNCIETIKGTAGELLEIFSTVDALWNPVCRDSGGMSAMFIPDILLKALSEDKTKTTLVSRGLIENISYTEGSVEQYAGQLVKPNILVAAVKADERCDLINDSSFVKTIKEKTNNFNSYSSLLASDFDKLCIED